MEHLTGVFVGDKSLREHLTEGFEADTLRTEYFNGVFVADKLLADKPDRVLTRERMVSIGICTGCGHFRSANIHLHTCCR